MNPEITLQWLREACPGLRQRFALAHLGVSGSVARGTAGPNSDVNILVEFEGPATLDDFMGLKAELEQLLMASFLRCTVAPLGGNKSQLPRRGGAATFLS